MSPPAPTPLYFFMMPNLITHYCYLVIGYPSILFQPITPNPLQEWGLYHKRRHSTGLDQPNAKKERYESNKGSNSEEEESADHEYFNPETYLLSKTHDVSEDIEQFVDKSFKKVLKRAFAKVLLKISPDLPHKQFKYLQLTPFSQTSLLQIFLYKKHNEQLAKIQGSIVTPVCNLWADFTELGLRGDSTELIPADVVLKTIKVTVPLVGNAFSYFSSQRRDNIVKAFPKSRANLAKILNQVSRKEIVNSGSDLFGEKAMSEVSKRISILESFRRSASTADPKPQGGGFLGERPSHQK